MSAGTKQINAMLGQLTTHADCFGNWSVADVQAIWKNPKEAIFSWRQMIADRRRKMVIPNSRRLDSGISFYLTVGGRVDSLSLYDNTILSDPNMTEFDYLSRHLILSDRVLDRSDFSVQEDRVGFKVLTLGDFGFDEHVETGVFMNNEFLEAWSHKHYSGHTLSLCRDTDFLFFAIDRKVFTGLGQDYIFAAKPVTCPSSRSLYVFTVDAVRGIDIRAITATAAHHGRLHTLVQRFVFRITPNEPKTRSARPKGKRK